MELRVRVNILIFFEYFKVQKAVLIFFKKIYFILEYSWLTMLC